MSSSVFPNQVDSFQTMQDIQQSDSSDVATYQQLLSSQTPLTPAQQTQLTQLSQKLSTAGKILSSDFLNHITDALISTQSFYLNSVQNDINNMENQFNAKVNKFSDRGTYNPATNYMDMNFVTWNGQSYICKQDNTVGIDPSHTSNWALVAQKGDTGATGPAGAALSYIGTYNSLSTYQANNLVSYNGSTYVCTQNNTINILPTNTTYWTLFVTGATPLAQNTSPTNPVTNQLWIDTSRSFPVLWYYTGSQWSLLEVFIEPTGTATSTTNYGSYQFQFQRSYWDNSLATPAATIKTSYFYEDANGVLHFANESGTSIWQIDQSGNTSISGSQSASVLIASGLTGATSSSRYVGATTSGAPTTGVFSVGDWVVDQSGKIWICTTAGTPGTWTSAGITYVQGTGITISGNTITNAGVTSVNGQTGAVTVQGYNPLNSPNAWF